MKIALIAPLYYSVPPKTYGGTEAVIYNLAEGLIKKNYDVTVFASDKSEISANLDSTFGKELDINNVTKEDEEYRKKRIEYIITKSNNFDIIHNHDALIPILFENQFKCPMVSTWHAPFRPEALKNSPEKLEKLKKTTLISISNSQRKSLPDANFVATVYNGTTDLNTYSLGNGGDYLVWIGRFKDYKGAGDAVQAALKANKKLVLAGSKFNQDEIDYFNKEVKNYIDDKKIKYIGEVNLEQKVPLLQNAMAFLMPIHWEEPFGLVMIEALSCGTPVIAYSRGSVPEIVEDGKNGFIICENDIDGMAIAIKNIDEIDRKYCRESVKRRFSIEKMVAGYEEVYCSIIKDKTKQ